MDRELDGFKRIDLRQFAASVGYEEDVSHRSARETVMRRDHDKISIRLDVDGHYVYYSFRDATDHGTIIDFTLTRNGRDWRRMCEDLRRFATQEHGPSLLHFKPLVSTPKDRISVERSFRQMRVVQSHPYLRRRGIVDGLLGSPRFAGRVRIDHRGNAVFPHYDLDGLCGYELKNQNFTGFAPHGAKGLWVSRTVPADQNLIVAESAIECLSYALLFPGSDDRRFASVAGAISQKQEALIAALVQRLEIGAVITAAMNADEAGQRFCVQVRTCVERSGRNDLRVREHLPHEQGRDWNDLLTGSSFPAVRN
jgi:hypothetical protein